MRILFFAQAFHPIVGGAERFLAELARRLSVRGHDVTVLAARVRGKDNRLDAPYRIVRYRKPFSKRFLPRHTVIHLLRATIGARPDCVHAHGAYPPGYSAALYARWTGLPFVVRPIGGDVIPGEAVRADPRQEERVRRTLLAADRVVAQSLELESLVRDLGVPAERIARIPNGVDLAAFAPAREATSGAAPIVAAMGMFFPKKGFDVLVDAFAEVRRKIPGARLELAGEGRERANLEARIRELGLEDSVRLLGVLDGDAKKEFLARASVFVSSSRREPFSNANLEALAAGLPIVATAVGGNLEIVTDGDNGRLVPPEDPRALAAAIGGLLADPEQRRRSGERSRARAGEYSWDRIVESYENVYSEVVGAHA